MTDQRKITAPKNAKLSTGPRTKEGKKRSAKNSTKHGLTSSEVVLESEDRAAFLRMKKGLIEDLNPEGQTEAFLADRIASCMWRLQRIARIESGMNAALHAKQMELTTRGLAEASERAARELSGYGDYHRGSEGDIKQGLAFLEGSFSWRLEGAREASAQGAAMMADEKDAFGRLSRYEVSIERSMYKALHELQRIQAKKRGIESVPVAADINLSVGA